MPIVTRSKIVAPPDVGRVDRIVQTLAQLSRSRTRGLFDHGCVQVNERDCDDPARRVEVGDVISVRFDPSRRYAEKNNAWRDSTFSVVFEDRYLIVVNKAAHVLSVPTDRGETNTLLDRVGEYLRHKRGVRQAFVVHRLDRGVSGLMLFAKNRDVAQQLQELFRTRAISRTYLAVVSGTMENASGTFQSHLATAENLDRFSTANGREGELAVTHYRVLKQLPDVALVEVKLETGRRNQIRVHFAEAGHPVLGDERYGGANARRAPWSEHRLALHAERLDFVHPQTRKKLALRSPLPKEFEGVVSAGI